MIEILVVLAILGILAAVLFVAIGTSPQRESRDARRIADLNQLQLALAMHQQQKGSYPDTLSGLISAGIIAAVAVDPNAVPYFYAVTSDKQHYHLGANIENPKPLSNLSSDADFNSLNPPVGELWLNGFDGRDKNSGGTSDVYDVRI